jgi:hypothetical protein
MAQGKATRRRFEDAVAIVTATLVVDGGRLLVGREQVDLFGKCDPSELADDFEDLRREGAAPSHFDLTGP